MQTMGRGTTMTITSTISLTTTSRRTKKTAAAIEALSVSSSKGQSALNAGGIGDSSTSKKNKDKDKDNGSNSTLSFSAPSTTTTTTTATTITTSSQLSQVAAAAAVAHPESVYEQLSQTNRRCQTWPCELSSPLTLDTNNTDHHHAKTSTKPTTTTKRSSNSRIKSNRSNFLFRMIFLASALALSALSCLLSTLHNTFPLLTMGPNRGYDDDHSNDSDSNDNDYHNMVSIMMMMNTNSSSNSKSRTLSVASDSRKKDAAAPAAAAAATVVELEATPPVPHVHSHAHHTIFYNIFIGPQISLSVRIVTQQFFQIIDSLQRRTGNKRKRSRKKDSHDDNTTTLPAAIVVGLKYNIIVGQPDKTPKEIRQLGKELHRYIQTMCHEHGQGNETASFQLECRLLRIYGPGHDEQVTLTALHQHCVDSVANTDTNTNATTSSPQTPPPPTANIVTYLHSKGSFHSHNNNNRWRRHLTSAALNSNCIQAVTTNATRNPGQQQEGHDQYCHVCGLQFYTTWGHFFAGNMWTADCSYVSRLLKPADYEKQMDAVWKHVTTHGMQLHQQRLDGLYDGPPRPFWTRQLFRTGMHEDPLAVSCTGRYAAECWIGSHPDLNPCDMSPTASLLPWVLETVGDANKEEYLSLPWWMKQKKEAAVSLQFQTFPRLSSWYETIMQGSGPYNMGIPHLKKGILMERFFPIVSPADEEEYDNDSDDNNESISTNNGANLTTTSTAVENNVTTNDPEDKAKLVVQEFHRRQQKRQEQYLQKHELAKQCRLREYFLLPGLLLRFRHLYGQVPGNHSWMYTYYPDGDEIRNEVLAQQHGLVPQPQMTSHAMELTRELLHDTVQPVPASQQQQAETSPHAGAGQPKQV